MDNFSLQSNFEGDPAKALEILATTLSSSGFRVLSRSAAEMDFKGPPQPGNISEMNRYWGASQVKLMHKNGTLRLEAEMGEINRSNAIGRWAFIVMLSLAAITLTVTLTMSEGVEAGLIAGAGSLIFFGGMMLFFRTMVSGQERRIKASYESLFHNAAMLGRSV